MRCGARRSGFCKQSAPALRFCRPAEDGRRRSAASAIPFLSLATQRNASSAHVATLGRSWDEFYKARRSSETRKKERKQLRRLGELGEVRFIDVRTSLRSRARSKR